MKCIFFLLFFLFNVAPSLYSGNSNFSEPYTASSLYTSSSAAEQFGNPKASKVHTELADFSSWNLPFSVLGPDANPLNALPAALGGQSRVGSGNLMLLFKHR
ncbi:hypothetical protein [Holospora curviuscula]|uniref:Uncharacterized protein n=1 Tax=Holospora curviuscula TaxID=1082868 RepID=A0A2S5RHV4_9PROT|nr:hypothetical protein [Holospora curviuscula]PPE06890.1 hypothetical protein HCUR_00104 [Holospora curviuscula]